MKAFTHSPSEIFGNQIRYVVPLFQRPYVWNEEDQWQPLWEDVSALADRLLEIPQAGFGAPAVPPHFLGAIVIEAQLGPVQLIHVRHVIDGQQRLTTLQLLIDAAQWVVEHHGTPIDSQALKVLIQNNPQMVENPDHVFKVWPTDRDQAAFRAAMDNDAVVPKELSGSRIAQAHKFFVEKTEEWADVHGDPDKKAARLSALVQALREHLKLVVIDLEPGDNAQVIFETLNHRGTPLQASDLVKNLVFQVAAQQGEDVESLYRAYWADLDSDYWRQLVRQGRLFRPRIDVFLNRWLVMNLLREVPSDRVFSDFRDQVVRTPELKVDALLKELSRDAQVHRRMESLPENSVEGLFHYRVMKALDTQVVAPFLMWVLRHSDEQMPAEQRNKALRSLESWLVRRALCRLTSKDHNKLVLELMKELAEKGPAQAGDVTERFLNAQGSETRLWPTDDRVRNTLAEEPVYRNLVRARVRLALEALEDRARGPLGEGQMCPRGLTIEHVMPQAWREHWGADIQGDQVAGLARDRIVHTLGNLTLVSAKLNPTLSNRPWTDDEARARGLGDEGKRAQLLKNSQLQLNSEIVVKHPTAWTEQAIQSRTAELIEGLIETWPRPRSAVFGEVLPPTAEAIPPPQPADQIGKYQPLRDWLERQDAPELRLTFAEIEDVLGHPLPGSSRKYAVHWRSYDGSAVTRAIRDAGWHVAAADLEGQRVVLERDLADAADEQLEPALLPWGRSDDDPDVAAYLWGKLSPAARSLIRILAENPGQPVSAGELAEAVGIVSGPTGLAGVLTWPARHASALGRQLPVQWAEGDHGDPSVYSMDESTAALFRPLFAQ